MKKTLIFAIFLIVSLQMPIQPRTDNPSPKPMQIFKVPYGASYEEKWRPVFEKNLDDFNEFMVAYVQYVKDSKIMSQDTLDEFADFTNNFPINEQFYEEILAIQKLSGAPMQSLMLINYNYEIFSYNACTSIVIRDKNNNLILGRNLDYFMQELYSKIAIQFDFYNQNDVKFASTVGFVGYAFCNTATRYGKFAITLNQREKVSRREIYKNLKAGRLQSGYLINQAIFKTDNYEDAFQMLKKVEVVDAIYYIIAGTQFNQGAVIEKNPFGPSNFFTLTYNNWYLVATNYDQDEVDGDGRRTFCIQTLDNIGQKNITSKKLFDDVLHSFPDFHTWTLYTTVMEPTQYVILRNDLWY